MTPHVTDSRAGFTLVELILVIALIGVLAGLLLPTLGRARAVAQDTVSLSNLRSHAQNLAAYAGDWNDYVPAITHPRATLSVIRGGGEVHTAPYFHAAYLWNVALCDAYYEGQARHASFEHPGFKIVDATWNSYLLTASYMADTGYWAAETRLSDASQLGHSRLSRTLFASQKVLLTEWHPRFGLAFVRSDETPEWPKGACVCGWQRQPIEARTSDPTLPPRGWRRTAGVLIDRGLWHAHRPRLARARPAVGRGIPTSRDAN